MHRTMSPSLSQIRDRNRALDILIPRFLGALWLAEPSPTDPPGPSDTRLRIGGVSFEVNADLVIGGSPHNSGYMLHAYCRQPGEDWKKVFSAQIADVVFGDPKFFKYWGRRCAILSWKRGSWEDRVCSVNAEPRTLAHVHTAGLSRAGLRLRLA